MRRLFVALALLLLGPPPAIAAQTAYDEAEMAASAGDLAHATDLVLGWLASHPDDEAARFLAGRLASWSGRHVEATTWLAPLVLAHPENADYLAALGRTTAWSGDGYGALVHLDRARVLNPADFDVWVQEIRTLEELGGANAEAGARLRDAAARRFRNRELPAPANARPGVETRRFNPARAVLTG